MQIQVATVYNFCPVHRIVFIQKNPTKASCFLEVFLNEMPYFLHLKHCFLVITFFVFKHENKTSKQHIILGLPVLFDPAGSN